MREGLGEPVKPRRRVFLAALLAGSFFLGAGAPGRSFAAKLGLDPLMGDGAAGRNVSLSGVNFEAAASYAVTFGGYAPAPATVNADPAGDIAPAALSLPPLAAGFHDVVLASAGRTYTFTGAYRVWRNICLNPAQGSGKAGETWRTNGAIPAGGWSGMVFEIAGTGFAAGAAVPANSITVGGAATVHDAIVIGANGVMPSTTIIVWGDLANGRKDIVVSDGTAVTFDGAYEVRRSVGLDPARGNRLAGRTTTISGWGFADGVLPPNSVLVGGVTTTHPAAPIVNGAFVLTVTFDARVGNGANDVETVQEMFPGAFDGTVASGEHVAIHPVVLRGLPNEAFRMRGIANFGDGTIPADSTELRQAANVVSKTAHGAVAATGGAFPETWVRIVSPQKAETNRFSIYTPGKSALRDFLCVNVRGTIGLCPVHSGGALSYSASLTGFGFSGAGGIAADSITVGGAVATHAAAVVGDPSGMFGPLPLGLPPLPLGDLDIAVNDGTARAFGGLLHARRTIGLSFVSGPGTAGETAGISGYGFTASSNIGADSITFGGSGTTHAGVAVGADGSFPPETIALPVLASGPHDVSAQELFPQAYRVYDPRVELSKYADPLAGLPGAVVTYTFSFTNTGYEGDPPAAGFVLDDTLPGGMEYVSGSASITLPAATEWYDAGCPCWTGVEPAPADVRSIRWTLSSPLPSGAIGYASFQVTVQ